MQDVSATYLLTVSSPNSKDIEILACVVLRCRLKIELCLNSSTKMTYAQVRYVCSELQFQWETTYLDKQIPASTYSCHSLAELLHDLTVFTNYRHLSQLTTYHLPYKACTLKPTPPLYSTTLKKAEAISCPDVWCFCLVDCAALNAHHNGTCNQSTAFELILYI